MLSSIGLTLMLLNNNNVEIPMVVEPIEIELPMLNGQFYETSDRETMRQELIEFQKQEEIRLKKEQEAELKRLKEEEEKRLKAEEEARQRALLKPTFNPYNAREVSNITEKQFYQLLKGTGLYDVGWVFSFCEERFGVNGLFLLGLTALESGWGNSYRATHHNNLTGYNINSNASVYQFESRSESVIATARLISKDYLTENGRYFNGYSIQDINKKYCASSDWHLKIIEICNKLMNELKSL